jgi:hypothetical protein
MDKKKTAFIYFIKKKGETPLPQFVFFLKNQNRQKNVYG